MSKSGQISKTVRKLEHIKTWQLLLLLVIFLFVSATFLRLNKVGVNARMQAVVSADEAGNSESIQERLFDLQRYAAAHMNAQPEDIYLTKQYERDVQFAVEEAREASDTRNTIFKQADDTCRPQYTGYTQAYVQCVAAEQAKFPASDDPAGSVKLPNPAGYRHSFTSPLWSPDFAGWSVLVSIGILLLIITRLITNLLLRVILKRKYRHL